MPSTGIFRNGATSPTYAYDFDQSYDPLNGFDNLSGSSAYTAIDGDTCGSIALAVWGDASLWYLIAEANGLSASETLTAGQVVSVPAKSVNVHNSSDTYKVYDPNKATGDTSPSAPKPAKKSPCGVFGQIILAVIAIVVTVLTAGAMAAPAASLGQMFAAGLTALSEAATSLTAAGIAMAASAAGSVVSQGIGVATGLQSSFNWGAVAMSAIGAGVGAGVGALANSLSGTFGSLSFLADKTSVWGGLVRGAVGNMATQGIAVATGLQSKFSWTGVAAAGVGGGVGAWVGGQLADVNFGLGEIGNTGARTLVTGMAADIANAATRSLIDGSDFGDNILAALPDTIAQTIGNMVVGGMAGPPVTDPTNQRYDGKNVEQVKQILIEDAAQRSIDPQRYREIVASDPGFQESYEEQAKLIVEANRRGISLDQLPSVVGDKVPSGQSVNTSPETLPPGINEFVKLDGEHTFGTLADSALTTAMDSYNQLPEDARLVIDGGLAWMRGGPAGVIVTWGLNHVVKTTLSETGLDENVQQGVRIVGTNAHALLSGTTVEEEQRAADLDGGHEASLLVQAGGTILGIASFARLARAAGYRFTVEGVGANGGNIRIRRISPVRGVEQLITAGSVNEARSIARRLSGLGGDAVDFVQEIGPQKGMITGRMSPDGLKGWRFDFDDKKGFHVNWWDQTAGPKRANWLYGAITVKGGTQQQYWDLLQHLPKN